MTQPNSIQPLLGGHTGDPPYDPSRDPDVLKRELSRAQEKLEDLREELEAERKSRRTLETGVGEIRRQLQPLHLALRALFGEIEALPSAAGGDAGAFSSAVSDGKRKEWESWIEKFGRDTLNGKLIAALLDHQSMTVAQLRVVLKCAEKSAYEAVKRVRKLGLITKDDGGKYSLKEL